MGIDRNWCVTKLGEDSTLRLIIGDDVFDVAQYTATFAVNSIPSAQCQLAVGREVRSLLAAEIHEAAGRLRQMRKATVKFHPRGEYLPGVPWPGEFTIFEGYFMGFGFTKTNGKISVVANLRHWAVDLACSSALNQNSHPLNPAHLTAPALLQTMNGLGADQGAFLSGHTGVNVLLVDVVADYWKALKTLFCRIAKIPVAVGGTFDEGNCGGTGKARSNDRAVKALARIEGPADSGCTRPYKYGVPLPTTLGGVTGAADALALGVTNDLVTSYTNTTFWDKLITINSGFAAAFVPCIEFGLVIADLPAYNGGEWKVIGPNDYDSFQFLMDLDRPLRAVGIVAGELSWTGATEGGRDPTPKPPASPWVNGCWTENGPPEADADAATQTTDGIVWYQMAPPWIQLLQAASSPGLDAGGVKKQEATPSATTPAAQGGQAPDGMTSGAVVNTGNVRTLLNNYARSVFVAETLRGRSGLVGGKLRFDIAPGSVVRVKGDMERFLGGEDVLAVDQIGCVVSATILINAEASQAGTTFVLSACRSQQENEDATGRTNVEAHPIFGNAIHGGGKHGAPLVAGHEALEPVPVGDAGSGPQAPNAPSNA